MLYPDVLVDRQSADGDARVTTTALVVAEVLSPSTDLTHHLRRFERYKRVASLATYLVLDPKRPSVRLWQRGDGQWPPNPFLLEGRHCVISLSETARASISPTSIASRRPPAPRPVAPAAAARQMVPMIPPSRATAA